MGKPLLRLVKPHSFTPRSRLQECFMVIRLSWNNFDQIVSGLAEKIQADGKPEIIVGVQRGGLIAGVMLSHLLNVRCFLPFNIYRTVSDEIDSKKSFPQVGLNIPFTLVANKDVLIVDDIVGAGLTLKAVEHMISEHMPAKLRTLACVVNRNYWDSENAAGPETIISYVGTEVRGWVVFPWEGRGGYDRRQRQ